MDTLTEEEKKLVRENLQANADAAVEICKRRGLKMCERIASARAAGTND